MVRNRGRGGAGLLEERKSGDGFLCSEIFWLKRRGSISLNSDDLSTFNRCPHVDRPAAVLAVGYQVKFSIRPVQYDEGV